MKLRSLYIISAIFSALAWATALVMAKHEEATTPYPSDLQEIHQLLESSGWMDKFQHVYRGGQHDRDLQEIKCGETMSLFPSDFLIEMLTQTLSLFAATGLTEASIIMDDVLPHLEFAVEMRKVRR